MVSLTLTLTGAVAPVFPTLFGEPTLVPDLQPTEIQEVAVA
jgi:hypothetical protein